MPSKHDHADYPTMLSAPRFVDGDTPNAIGSKKIGISREAVLLWEVVMVAVGDVVVESSRNSMVSWTSTRSNDGGQCTSEPLVLL